MPHKFSFLILSIFFLSSNYIFAQKRPPAKTYHREELVEKIMQNTDFQAYYAEMQLVTNLYQKVILALNEQAFEKVDKSHEEGGYYYKKGARLILTDQSNDSLTRKEVLAFAEKIREDADRKIDSLRVSLSQLHSDTLKKRKKQLKEMQKKEGEEEYRKHEIFMRDYLKISPDAVNAHFEKATQYIIKLFDAFAQLQSTFYDTDDFSYVIEKSVKLYAQKKEKSKKNACLKKNQELINGIISLYIGHAHHSYLYSRESINTLEKYHFSMIHISLLGDYTTYRKCIDAQRKK